MSNLTKKNLKKISKYLYEIPKTFRTDMHVPARIYLDDKMLDDVFRDKSLEQLVNTATLPGVIKYVMAMPDVHEGYGFPIGGVAAMDLKTGVISPGGVGYDINCGTRLLISDLTEEEIKPYLEKIATELNQAIPSGVGSTGRVKLDKTAMDRVLSRGAERVVEQGYGEKEDLERCESYGLIKGADPTKVSEKAKARGRDQLGTLGSGNHFLEIQRVAEIFNEEIARTFGLFLNQITLLIHTGSRGLGHQVCTDYVHLMTRSLLKYNLKLPDRELACAPFNSPEGQSYFAAMASAANFAWANRQVITHLVRQVWQKFFNQSIKVLYDVAHNIGKIEEHEVDGQKIKLIVHRKGATRAFPPHHPELPAIYQAVGQPVLIPGSMGTASYLLVGTTEAKDSFYSVNHGAGRTMSRAAAKRKIWGEDLIKEMAKRGIIVKCGSPAGLAEEAPEAYKDIDQVVNIVHGADLAKKVARVVPLAVIKGE
ncbi:MAG: RtcB family protein [Patescibacteria group bacterium]|nr:RtcB family protein [Patescibacteria group bacterium]